MAARKGLARLVRVGILLALLGFGGWYAYEQLCQPGEVKRRVEEELAARFDGVDVEVGSARLRPFLGGVNVTDLKLIRRDDPTRTPFLHVPHAVIWHDKSSLATRLSPAKVEFEDAKIRLERNAAGKWNVEGIAKPPTDGEQAPIFVLKKAHVAVIDQKSGNAALLEFQEMDVTVINDPATVFTFEARGTASPIGPFNARGRYEQGVGASGHLDLTSITLGSDIARLIGMVAPEAVEPLQTVTGTASAKTRWAWSPERQPPIAYETEFELHDGRCTYGELPAAIEQLSLKARVKDADLVVESLTGKLGDSNLNVKLELDAPKANPKLPLAVMSIENLEERVRRMEITVAELNVGPELFERLPPNFAQARGMFNPSGSADVTYEQIREPGGAKKRIVFRPKGMAARYRGFPYPVDHIRGTVEATLNDTAPSRYEVDLVAEGGGKPISLKGHIIAGQDKDVDLLLTGSDITLDDTIINALPDDYPALIRRLRPTATGDFTAKIRQNARIRREHGPDETDNEFDIKVRTASINYEEFPYPLTNIKGNLYIRTVSDKAQGRTAPGVPEKDEGILEFRDFTATGPGGSKLKIKGGRKGEPGGVLLALDAKGESVPLDGELGRSLGKLKINNSWSTFDPSGRMNCEINVRIHDRDGPDRKPLPFNPNRDLELGIAFNGPNIRPTFFPYLFSEVAGQLSFAEGRVDLRQFRAKHGTTSISMPAAEILLPPTGGLWADLYDIKVTPIVFDRELLAALPKGIRSACLGLEPQGPIGIHAKRLVIDDQPKGLPPIRATPSNDQIVRTAASVRTNLPTVYWDGTVYLKEATIKTGITWEGVTGQFATRGLYMGDKLGRVVGHLTVDKARILKQPVENVTAKLEVDPAKPDVITVPWISGRVYGGEIGGQAKLEINTPVRFDLSLSGSRLKLEDFARINHLGPKTEMSGLATATINLSNPVDPSTHEPVLQGSGTIDVPNGRLFDMPVMFDVIKLARLRPMDHTAFEEAHGVFRIRGNRLKVGQIDLLGNAISLGGEGEMDLDGSHAMFEFYTVWTNIRNILGGGGDLAARISGNLFRIRVSGDLGSDKPPRVTQEALPGIVDPIRRLLGRASN